MKELIFKRLGGWAGLLLTIFRGPPTKQLSGKLFKNKGKLRKSKGRKGPPTKKWLAGPSANHS